MTNVNQAPLPRLSKRRWYVLRLLSGAISSTWLYLLLEYNQLTQHQKVFIPFEDLNLRVDHSTLNRLAPYDIHCSSVGRSLYWYMAVIVAAAAGDGDDDDDDDAVNSH